jgi:enolase-phosphatase E1
MLIDDWPTLSLTTATTPLSSTSSATLPNSMERPISMKRRPFALLRRWIEEDRKATPLKTLQGLIWADGYKSGAFQGHIYDDAAAALRDWQAQGIALYVYSSGSIAAQKLLFRFSSVGDLTPMLRGYFDTTVGAKTDPASYRRIVTEIGAQPGDIAFLSDYVPELDAAGVIGVQTVCVQRDDRAPATTQHIVVRTLAGLFPPS